MSVHDWSIPGADGEPILGTTHIPPSTPHGVIIIAHGFKGYKDYGMFPRIASRLADAGLIVIRFNFSHSGMTNRIETFEKPELFERDTWNKQVFDLRAVILAASGTGPSAGGGVLPERVASVPIVLFGHSRGGVAAMLTAGRHGADPDFPKLAAVITAAAPDTCNSLSEEDLQRLLDEGFIDSPSSRTGQTLRVGSAFLREQRADPENHDVLAMASRISCPLLVIHGEDDATVSPSAAHRIAEAAGENARILLIADADHVFNTPNPLDEQESSSQLGELIDAMLAFIQGIR